MSRIDGPADYLSFMLAAIRSPGVSTLPSDRTVENEGFVLPEIRGNVTKCAPHKALKLIARGELTCDERFTLALPLHHAPPPGKVV